MVVMTLRYCGLSLWSECGAAPSGPSTRRPLSFNRRMPGTGSSKAPCACAPLRQYCRSGYRAISFLWPIPASSLARHTKRACGRSHEKAEWCSDAATSSPEQRGQVRTMRVAALLPGCAVPGAGSRPRVRAAVLGLVCRGGRPQRSQRLQATTSLSVLAAMSARSARTGALSLAELRQNAEIIQQLANQKRV
jgi:hypothetical protein